VSAHLPFNVFIIQKYALFQYRPLVVPLTHCACVLRVCRVQSGGDSIEFGLPLVLRLYPFLVDFIVFALVFNASGLD
jgi:hypothetical protein